MSRPLSARFANLWRRALLAAFCTIWATNSSAIAADAADAQTRILALEQRALHAEHIAALRLYASQLADAQLAWEMEDVQLAYRRLEQCEPALRGWEYVYLLALLQSRQRTLKGHTDGVIEVAFSNDEKHVASVGYDGAVRVWSTLDGSLAAASDELGRYLSAVAFFPDGRTVAASGDDGSVRLWRFAEPGPPTVAAVFDDDCSSLGIAPGGSLIACGSAHSDEVRLLDPASLKVVRTVELGASANCLCYAADGRLLVGDRSGRLSVWAGDAKSRLRIIPAYEGVDEVRDASLSADGARIVSCRRGGSTLDVWDAATGAKLLELPGHESLVGSVRFSADGDRIISTGWDDVVRVWDATSGVLLKTLKGHTDDVFCAVFSPTGKWIASASRDTTVKIWDAERPQDAQTLRLGEQKRPSAINCVAFSPAGEQLLSCGISSDKVIVWDICSGAPKFELKGLAGRAQVAGYSPGGAWIAGGSDQGMIALWDAVNGETKWILDGFPSDEPSLEVRYDDQSPPLAVLHYHRVTSVAISPDEKLLAAASDNRSVKILSVSSGEELLAIKTPSRPIAVTFLGNGAEIAACAHDGQVRVWDVESGAVRKSYALRKHAAPVTNASWSPDESWIVTSSQDQTLKTWDASTGVERCTLSGHTDDVWGAAISPDNKRIASSSSDAQSLGCGHGRRTPDSARACKTRLGCCLFSGRPSACVRKLRRNREDMGGGGRPSPNHSSDA